MAFILKYIFRIVPSILNSVHVSHSLLSTHIGPPEYCLRILTEVIKRFTNLIGVEAETDGVWNI